MVGLSVDEEIWYEHKNYYFKEAKKSDLESWFANHQHS
jgi:hypothetical protein